VARVFAISSRDDGNRKKRVGQKTKRFGSKLVGKAGGQMVGKTAQTAAKIVEHALTKRLKSQRGQN
jgi:hypothetical protein